MFNFFKKDKEITTSDVKISQWQTNPDNFWVIYNSVGVLVMYLPHIRRYEVSTLKDDNIYTHSYDGAIIEAVKILNKHNAKK